MKRILIAISLLGLLSVAQTGFAQTGKEIKAAKKEIKAEKKMAKAEELKTNADTRRGVEVAGVSDAQTRHAKADRKMEKAQKKVLKAEAKELKAASKEKRKQAADVNN